MLRILQVPFSRILVLSGVSAALQLDEKPKIATKSRLNRKHVTPRQHRAQRAEDLRKREDVVSAKEGLLSGLSDGIIDARPDGGGSSIVFADKVDDARKSYIEEKINRAKPAAIE